MTDLLLAMYIFRELFQFPLNDFKIFFHCLQLILDSFDQNIRKMPGSVCNFEPPYNNPLNQVLPEWQKL